MYSYSNTVLVQSFIVSLQFLSIVNCYLLKWALIILEENMFIREIIKWLDNAYSETRRQ